MLTAITRKVSPLLASCELEFHRRIPIDVARAAAQHREYEKTLERLGVHVVSLPTLDGQPDCVFVEDPALVLDEIAVSTRMGAESRRGEAESLAQALEEFRPVVKMQAPATLEGGDVVRVGRTLYVGLSRRTNSEGVAELRRIVEPLGYHVIPVPVIRCLHLKSACCALGRGTLLMNADMIDSTPVSGPHVLHVPEEEPWSADSLWLQDTVVIPSAYPKTVDLLCAAGFDVLPIDVSELMKAEAGVTCMSLIFESEQPSAQ
jgi:dimethylargininase